MAKKEYNVQINFLGRDKLTKSLVNVKAGLKSVEAVAKKVAIGVAGVTAGLGAMAVTVDKMSGRGGKVIKMRNDFAKLAETIHSSSTVAMAKMRKETQGLIDDYTLMSRASKMLMMGLVDNDDQMAKAIKYAIRFGDVTMSNEQKVDSFISMLKNSNLMLVDNFGLTRSQVTAEMELLEKTKGLDKAKAFSVAVTDLLGKKYKLLGDATETSSNAFDRLKVKMINLKDDILVKLDPLFAKLIPVVDKVSNVLDKVGKAVDGISKNGVSAVPMLQNLVNTFERLKEKLIPVYNWVVSLTSGFWGQLQPALTSLWGVLKKYLGPALKDLWSDLKDLWYAFFGNEERAKEYGEILGGVAKLIAGTVVVALFVLIGALRALIKLMTWVAEAFGKMIDLSAKLSDKIKKLGSDIQHWLIDKLIVLLRKFGQVKDKLPLIGTATAMSNQTKAWSASLLKRFKFFATGGTVNGPTVVGEHGSELLIGNRIIPHSSINNYNQEKNVTIVNNYNNTSVNPEVVASTLSYYLNTL